MGSQTQNIEADEHHLKETLTMNTTSLLYLPFFATRLILDLILVSSILVEAKLNQSLIVLVCN